LALPVSENIQEITAGLDPEVIACLFAKMGIFLNSTFPLLPNFIYYFSLP